MGKQNRRKRRNRRASEETTDSQQSNTTSTLLLRIRHADAQTRHGALAALSATLLSPEELSVSKRTPSTNLLQAVRERVMDTDLECAQAAAGCLSNYVSFSRNVNMDLTSGWTVVLLGRLEKCREALATQSSSQRQWWALAVQCLHALCTLIEVNPQALDRVTQQSANALFGTLLGLVSLGRNELNNSTSAKKKQDETEWVQDVVIYTTRTLHSALDDNVELLLPWINSNSTCEEGINLLQSSCLDGTLPAPARLHAAGCLVTARQLLCNQEQDSSRAMVLLQRHVVDTVIDLLQQFLDYRVDVAGALLNRLLNAKHQLEKEEADVALEQEVIESVNRRKEPARLIAKRQKEIKQQKQHAKKDEHKMDEEEETDKADEMKDEEQEHVDYRQEYEKARKAWHCALLPLQLALEISANLTGGFAMEGNADMESLEDCDMDWGPDQEAQLLQEATAPSSLNEGGDTKNPLDRALEEAIVSKGLPDRLVALLKSVCTDLSVQLDTEKKEVPSSIGEELADLQSKCGGCIGNCLGNLASWRTSDALAVWKELVQGLQLLMSSSATTSSGMEGICSAMVVALRSRPGLRSQMQQGDLDLLIGLLSHHASDEMAVSAGIQRDAACMLGILCSSETHSAEINTKVCSSLLSTRSSSAMVQSEVLNALIDIYGDDDVHADVFDSLQVLGYFQKTVPLLKKRIRAEADKYPEEEVEQWKETALNASRFIQYKKGQL